MMPFGRLSFVLGAFFLAGGVASIASGKLMHAAQKTSPGGMLLFGALAPRADKPINICTVRCNLSAAAFFAVSALECPVWLLHRV
jgi:hypothetical protein